MSAANQPPSNDGDMPAEIDFRGGVRGQFYRPNAKLNLPVYLDAEVQAYLAHLAQRKGAQGGAGVGAGQ